MWELKRFRIMNGEKSIARVLLASLVGLCGGVLGHFIFIWMAQQGFYALLIPGAFVGMGAAMILKERSVPLMIICGVLGLALGILSEWRLSPFIADHSLSYFITHFFDLRPLTRIMVLLGAACAAYLARGRAATPNLPTN